MPFDKNSSCFECHRDMYAATDLFDHRNHVEKLKGNDGCVRCHTDPGEVKNRDTALACVECHADMLAEGSAVRAPEEASCGDWPRATWTPCTVYVLAATSGGPSSQGRT